MAPAAELERPAVQCTSLSGGTVQAGNFPLSVKNGQSFRLKAEIDPLNATHIGFTVRGDASTAEYTALYCGYSRENSLIMDTTHSGLPGPHDMRGGLLFYLPLGKRFPWIFFVDKSVVEIFVTTARQSAAGFYPSSPMQPSAYLPFRTALDYGIVQCMGNDARQSLLKGTKGERSHERIARQNQIFP